MNKFFTRTALIGLAGTAFAGAAQAQMATNNLLSVPTNQNVASVAAGNGTQQSARTARVDSNGQPAIGVGALSGSPDHYGSAASVSVANTDRILGVDGPGGRGGENSVSVANARSKPVLAPN